MLRVLQIVQSLLQQGKHASKRDLYYTDPDQATVNQALIDISVRLKCTRSSLHVVSVGKGLIMGSLRFKDADRTIDCSVCNPFFNILFLDHHKDISSCAEYIIVVEKETVFQRLANDGFCRKNNCIVLTGRGYPDVATRSFLRLLAAETKLPVYGLVDADPYGLDILATYRFGSPTMAYDAEALATPSIRWLGVFLSDCQTHNVPDRCLLSLTNDDRRKAEAMLNRDYLKHLAFSWNQQLRLMLEKGVKLELEALSASKFSALADDYIPHKIKAAAYLC
ncbi:hypothetical protein SELMODRAFT_123469 [Selaginella moellendorffii]|uniref:DNA topoisomerase (ATP-hydrolyzing) n=1 Tax=Selaginella moellendorffii TaxID=88036 RepID=D8SRM4_SELML|nr:hypothetical protein SELMODRAFT_123469 [Selaginella moellendorffii]